MTPSYDVLVGIDQGEIISPLLWTIYYDPLLVEINDNPQFGYEMSHTWLPNVSLPESKTESVIVSSQAYMDDTSWISSSKEKLECTLSIADEFYTLNNIQVNKLKSVLLTTCNTYDNTSNSREVTLSFGQEQIVITPAARNESVRVLGVWISLSSRKNFIMHQCEDIIRSTCNMMRFKRLTAEQLKYIWNTVICPGSTFVHNFQFCLIQSVIG